LREDNEPLKFFIDWELEKDAFQSLVRDMIKNCVDHGKVISLPFIIVRGQSFLDQLGLLLSQVDCRGCNNRCCRTGEDGIVSLTPQEGRIFLERYGQSIFTTSEEGLAIPYPCRFLEGHKCSIYPERPLVCTLYPFQPGGFEGEERRENVIAISAQCPEGKRIARAVYMTTWRLRKQFKRAIGNFN
jgi:Fe-S-cluster containining protein